VVLLAVAFVVGLQFRAGGGTSSTSTSAGSAPALPGRDRGAAAGQADGTSSSGGEATAGKPAPSQGSPNGAAPGPVVGPKLARSAWLGIRVTDLLTASGKVRSLTAAAGGLVLSENVVTAPDPTGGPPPSEAGSGASVPAVGVDEAQLTVRVPAEKLDGLVSELSRIGTVSYQSSASEDLTDAYVDTSARIGPMRDAVAQARALLAKATSLGQIIELENEVTRRQADLDSLESRLATLERRTTTSDVTVSLWTSATQAAPATTGFVGQLRAAWGGLLDSVAVIVTGLAVLLPWLALLLVALLLGRRWWARRTPAAGRGAAGVPD
jgi:hypothetical protein